MKKLQTMIAFVLENSDNLNFAGMTGVIDEIYSDGSFYLKCKTNGIVVSCQSWIWINGKEVLTKK